MRLGRYQDSAHIVHRRFAAPPVRTGPAPHAATLTSTVCELYTVNHFDVSSHPPHHPFSVCHGPLASYQVPPTPSGTRSGEASAARALTREALFSSSSAALPVPP